MQGSNPIKQSVQETSIDNPLADPSYHIIHKQKDSAERGHKHHFLHHDDDQVKQVSLFS